VAATDRRRPPGARRGRRGGAAWFRHAGGGAGPWFGVERLALRGLLAACALCAASVAFHYATGELAVEGEDEALIEFVNTDYELS
jgi:hypothetical protein